ncbi:ATPase, partial [Acinetobacter baumannii]
MHGEYQSLASGPAPIASFFKIAGPGDLDSTDPCTIFLPYWLLNREEMLSMILDRSDQNAPNQASRFTQHVRALKAKTLT